MTDSASAWRVWRVLYMCVRVRYLGGQQRVGVETLHAADQLVPGVDHIIHKAPVEQEPIRASIHRNALWDLSISKTPHVGVALVEETVQALFTDETERTLTIIQPEACCNEETAKDLQNKSPNNDTF